MQWTLLTLGPGFEAEVLAHTDDQPVHVVVNLREGNAVRPAHGWRMARAFCTAMVVVWLGELLQILLCQGWFARLPDFLIGHIGDEIPCRPRIR